VEDQIKVLAISGRWFGKNIMPQVLQELAALQKQGIILHTIAKSASRSNTEKILERKGMKFHLPESSSILEKLKYLFVWLLNSWDMYLISPKDIFKINTYTDGIWGIKQYYFILRIIKDEKIDLIHSHFILPSPRIIQMLKKKTRIPIVCSCRGFDVIINPSIQYGKRLNKSYNYSLKKSSKYIDFFIPNSDYTKNFLNDIEKDMNKIKTLHNGFDIGEISNTRNEIKNHSVFSVGYSYERKNVYSLLQAIKILIKKFPNITLTLCGMKKGSEDEKKIKTFSESLKISNHVNIIYQLEHREFLEEMSKHEICVHCAIEESCPNVILEYMAYEKPVICSNVGGSRELVENNKTGFHVDPKNIKDIADKIERLLRNPKIARGMGLAGLRRVESQFTLEKKAKSYIEIYEQVLRRTPQFTVVATAGLAHAVQVGEPSSHDSP
jgi:glycosyltransferase involved in cell wall biosynthesis